MPESPPPRVSDDTALMQKKIKEIVFRLSSNPTIILKIFPLKEVRTIILYIKGLSYNRMIYQILYRII